MEPTRKERRAAALNNPLTSQTLLDFDLGESSSDSDFLPPDQDDSDDDFNSDDDDADDKDDGSESDDESSDSDLGLGDSKKDKKKASDVVESTTPNLLSLLETNQASKKIETMPSIPKKAICCACLGDRSDDSNEIVECDGCGVTVHEGCYGISESNSVSSTASSCSTEPWFCEACRASVHDPDCELCPNKGGAFKETDCGRWVSKFN